MANYLKTFAVALAIEYNLDADDVTDVIWNLCHFPDIYLEPDFVVFQGEGTVVSIMCMKPFWKLLWLFILSFMPSTALFH